jgi:CRISPR-associated endonuclease/helicase Cas3
MSMASHVDLAFPARGLAVPLDHGYALYGALCRSIPGIHGACWIAVHGISGWRTDDGVLALGPAGDLRVRVPDDRIGAVLSLAGATLDIAGHRVELGTPSVHALAPVSALEARLVVIRLTGGLARPFDGVDFERRFVAEARRQLAARDIRGELELRGRRGLRVGGQRVLGHAVRVLGLSAGDSLRLQVGGLGGKRAMGCGIFRPAGLEAPLEPAA